MIDAYCDTCFTPCAEADAHDRKSCRKCGNRYFFIIDREHPTPSGNLAYRSTRERNLDAFLGASMVMSEIRITTMTIEDFERFVSAGEACLAVYDKAQDEEKEREKRAGLKFELPPVVDFPIRLPDMYMRYGRWDDARRVRLRFRLPHT
jgi:predicted  nucleic acid-binding Zn-ribbon protein